MAVYSIVTTVVKIKNILTICLVLLVLSKGVIDGLSCIGDNFIEISFHELTHDEFQELLDEPRSSNPTLRGEDEDSYHNL